MIRRIAMVSLRAGFSPLFLCLRASRSVLTPPFENCVPLWAGRTVELLPKLKPAVGCPQQAGQRAHEPDPLFLHAVFSLQARSQFALCPKKHN